jgi:hypothetical protein
MKLMNEAQVDRKLLIILDEKENTVEVAIKEKAASGPWPICPKVIQMTIRVPLTLMVSTGYW